ncbi:MAG: VWA domain-containing protein [Candidatus Firestonebacteria bacterium]|nr:VWA domain-containing protein [Candidatus Firestonebacteria bacterium]
MRFMYPMFLLLLIIPVYMFYYYKFKMQKYSTGFKFSDLGVVKKIKKSARISYSQKMYLVRIASVCFIILALARLQAGKRIEEILTEGVDIVLAVDVSGSMRSEDFKPQNRLEVAKEVVKEFIKDRKHDRIGLVAFASESYTQCPLTLDYGVLLSFVDNLNIGMIKDGTAVGMGIASSVNRLRKSKAKSKVIILLTDGRNNTGKIDPETAANLAHSMGIKIYTIGAGKPEGALLPVEDPFFGKRYIRVPLDLDEESLTKIANITGGLYFRAESEDKLKEIYKKIGEMEKTKIETKEYMDYTELYQYFVFHGMILLLTEIFLTNTIFRKIP